MAIKDKLRFLTEKRKREERRTSGTTSAALFGMSNGPE